MQIKCSDYKWFPHDTVLDNLIHQVGTITVPTPPGGRHDKEASLSPDPDIDTEDAALPHNLQDMFSIGHNYQEDSGRLMSYNNFYKLM